MTDNIRIEPIRVDAYAVLERAVEEGIAHGWRRAHKHTDTPDEDAVRGELISAVMSEICEWFEFPTREAQR